MDQRADFEIPRLVWSNWAPAYGRREVIRALTDTERDCVQRRANALGDGLRSFSQVDHDEVAGALHAMFSGYRQMREQGDNATAMVKIMMAVLSEFPAWAITEACLRIARDGVPQGEDDLPDRRFPPNNGQVYAAVAAAVAPFRKQLKASQSLLVAPVEPPPMPRPTAAAVAASLGRVPSSRPWRDVAPEEEPSDGKHTARVMKYLERRRKAQEASQSEGTSTNAAP